LRVEQFQKRVKRACLLLDLPEPELVDLKAGSVKLRIQLSEERFIEVYFNEKRKTLDSAMIEEGRRIFGINGYASEHLWHIHPLGKMDEHVPVKPMSIERLLRD
jgi:hypothetical protein